MIPKVSLRGWRNWIYVLGFGDINSTNLPCLTSVLPGDTSLEPFVFFFWKKYIVLCILKGISPFKLHKIIFFFLENLKIF